MAVIRVEKTRDYTTMSNYHFKEKDMSLKAKGLLSMILSLPEDWDYTLEGLSMLCKDGKDSVRTALNELMEFGYVETARVRDEKGQLRGTEYVVYERPVSKEPLADPALTEPALEEPVLEEPTLGKPTLENPTQLNTNILNTNLSKTNLSKTNVSNHNESGTKPEKNSNSSRAYYPDNPQLNDAFRAFVYMRKKINKPLTDTAMRLIRDSLAKMTKGKDGKMNIEKAVGILNQSVMNGWPGLYDLKKPPEENHRGQMSYNFNEEEWTNLESQLIAN